MSPGSPASDAERRAAQAGSFGAAAEVYERSRPGYPEAALDWLLPPEASDVVDLGAGTGKLTRQLVARGHRVTAVEPSDGMREALQATVPGVPALTGTGEEIPLPDGCADVVIAAQAWHWVDPLRAAPEVARVLRPGGRIALVWNDRDERVSWVAALGEIMTGGVEQMDSADPVVGPPFGPLEHHQVAWSHSLTPDGLIDLVASRSFYITAPPERQARVREQLRDLARTHPDLAGRETFELPYVTHCTRGEPS